jgi:hypothetical protein
MKKREDLDLTTIVDQAFRSYLEATAMPGTINMLPPAKIEAMKRAWVGPIFHAIPHIIDALEGRHPAVTDGEDEPDAEAAEHAQILASFKVPDSLDGLLS